MKPEIRKPTDAEKTKAKSWPVWTKEASEFPYEYDSTETCLILEGDVTITNETGEQFHFAAGDWVVFPTGMHCTWKINQAVKKHYNFS
jgi:uncharacterized cupin superfamily protein